MLTGRKGFDGWQVVCQFLGIGLYTHGARLVNVTTWFMSVLLTLLLVVAAAKWSRRAWPVVVGATYLGVAAVCLTSPGWEYFISPALIFLISYTVARWRASAWRWVATAALIPVADAHLAYNLGAVVVAVAAAEVSGPGWRWAEVGGRYGYEWFLVHGPCIQACHAVVGESWLVYPLAVVVTAAGSVGLRHSLLLTYRALGAVWVPSPVSAATPSTAVAERQGQVAGSSILDPERAAHRP